MSKSQEPAAIEGVAEQSFVHSTMHGSLKDDVFGGADTQLLSVSDAAKMLKLSESTTIRLIEKKVLCAKRDITGKRWLVQRECVLAQLEDGDGSHGVTASTDDAVMEDETHVEAPFMDDVTLELNPRTGLELGENITAALDYIFTQSDFIGTAYNTEEDGTTTTVEVEEVELTGIELASAAETFDRQAITDNHVEEILGNLEIANVRLEGAMYRIGYLEAQVESYEEQVKVLPEFRNRAARAILTERENDILKAQMVEHEAAVATSYELIEKLHTSRWYRFWAWICGVPMPARPLPQQENS